MRITGAMESAKFSTTNNSNLSLKQQVMLNQLISIAGCSFEDGIQLLVSSNWQYQVFIIKNKKKDLKINHNLFILGSFEFIFW